MSRICMDTFEFHLFFFFTSFGPTDVSHPQCFKIIDVFDVMFVFSFNFLSFEKIALYICYRL